MKTSHQMFVVLTVVSLLSGGLLSALNDVTLPRIREHQLQELRAAISEVLPPYDRYEEISQKGMTLYVGRKEGQSEPVGVAFRAVGNGFQGKVAIMVGIRPDFEALLGIKVLEQLETPGLGTKIVEDPSHKSDPFWFAGQFKGLKVAPAISVIKNVKPSKPTEIQAISGATISSNAVVAILNEQIAAAKTVFQQR